MSRPVSDANAHMIIPRLWLGNIKAAADEGWMKRENVTVVFNCTKDLPFADSIATRYRIAVHDNLEPEEIQFMIDSAEDIAYNILKEYKQGKTILVHCYAGMQRSAAALAIFLMLWLQMKPYPAMEFIKSKRPIAFYPSANFAPAIYAFHTRLEKIIRPYIEEQTTPRPGAWMAKKNQ
jgi:rhodanese-related sulfurtransferase